MTQEANFYEASVRRDPAGFPQLMGHKRCDVCIIGGGYTGLHTARLLAGRGYRVIILEATQVGFGASGKNGGQINTGYACGMEAFQQSLGQAAAKDIWSLAVTASAGIRGLIETHGIACDYQPGHMEVAVLARKIAALQDWRDAAARDFGDTSFEFIGHSDLGRHVRSERYLAGLYDPRGGHLHPLKFVLGLAKICTDAGVEIFERSSVSGWTENGRIQVQTGQGEVTADHLVIAANTGVDNLDPMLSRKILPIGTYMIATEPLPAALAAELIPSRAAISDTQFILDYFRLTADHRLLFGGGVSYTGQTPKHIVSHLRKRMLRVFPKLNNTRIDNVWGGYIDISRSRMPMIGRRGKHVLHALGFAGAGLVPTFVAGQIVSEAIAGTAERLDMFSALQHRDFPGGRYLRGPLTALAMSYYRLRDYF